MLEGREKVTPNIRSPLHSRMLVVLAALMQV